MADLRVDWAFAIVSECLMDDFIDNSGSGEGSFEEVLAESGRDALLGLCAKAVNEEGVELMALETGEEASFFYASLEREEGGRVEVFGESWETGEDNGEEGSVFELGLGDHADLL
jgi:hypothetical protein